MLKKDQYHSIRYLIAGYQWRRDEYLEKLKALRLTSEASGASQKVRFGDDFPLQASESDALLFAFEQKVSSRLYHAIENGREALRRRFGEQEGELSFRAFLRNAQEPRRYSFTVLKRRLDLPYELSTFKRYRTFLYEAIASFLAEN